MYVPGWSRNTEHMIPQLRERQSKAIKEAINFGEGGGRHVPATA